MKKPIFLILLVLLLIAAGYLVYQKLFQPTHVVIWDVVPGNALVVYERDDCANCHDRIENSPVVSLFERALSEGKSDSLFSSITDIIKNHGAVISVHAVRKDDFDFIYYLQDEAKSRDLLSKVASAPNIKSGSREFNGVQIHEVKTGKNTFSWVAIENLWIGSFTPFLIEDVIRTFRSSLSPFKRNYAQVLNLPQIKGDAGNLYVNLKNVSSWLSLFSNDNPMLLASLGHSSALDLKVENSSLILNGFSADSADHSNYVLSIFGNQAPVTFNLQHLISDRAITVNSFGISDGALFYQDLMKFREQRTFKTVDSISWLNQKAGIDLKKLFGSINDEVVECFIESSKRKRASKILIIETDKAQEWMRTFDMLGEKLSMDTIFAEPYANFTIREVPVNNFPEKLFWPLVTGYPNTFYTRYKNYVLIGDDVDELKVFLDDIDNDNTWGRSVAFNKFFETTLLESNFSIYINTPKVWNSISESLRPRWKRFVTDNQKTLRTMYLSAIQFSHLNNSYYTHATVNYKSVAPGSEGSSSSRLKTLVNFPANISGLFIVKSHITKNDEILIQDSLNDLSLVGSDGNVLWKLPVGDRIVSEVSQIDFFGNGKLQYFFATPNTLHVIDRLGKYVDPYPLYLPSLDVAHATVVDYDHSKKYRFLVAEHTGKLWMYDKDGTNLEGWQPKDIGGKLVNAPRHYRIHGRDYIIAVRQDGGVYLMTRRGEDIKGFPLSLGAAVSGEFFLERSGKLSDTHFVLVTNDGFKVKFSIDGKIQSKETLLKTSVNTSFSLVREEQEKSYVVVQRDGKTFNLLDETGKTIITNGFIGGHPAVVKYFDFGSGRIYAAITDQVENLAYLHNDEGDLMTSPPLESTMIGLRPVNTDDVKLFMADASSLTILSIE